MPHPPSALGGTLALIVALAASLSAVTSRAETIPSELRELLSSHCTDCHDSSTRKGGVQLDFQEVNWSSPTQTALLERVHDALAKGTMPPPKEDRAPVALSAPAIRWIDHGLTIKKPKHATPYRRLNRIEYLHTVQRLFDGSFQLPPGFPEDTRSHGFDNVAESLVFSPPLLEAYTESATRIANRIFRLPRNVASETRAVSVKDFSIRERDLGGVTTLLTPSSMRLALLSEVTSPNNLPIHASGTYRLHLKAVSQNAPPDNPPILKIRAGAAEVEILVPTGTVSTFTTDLVIHEGAKLQFEHSNAPHPHFVRGNFKKQLDTVKHRLKSNPTLLACWLSFHEEKIAQDKKIQFVRKAEYAGIDDVAFSNIVTAAFEKLPDLAAPAPEPIPDATVDLLTECMARSSEYYVQPWNWLSFHRGPAIDLLGLAVEGPINRVEDPDDRAAQRLQQNLLGTPPDRPGSPEWLQHCSQKILERAFRRPPSAQENAAYANLASEHLSDGHTPTESLHHLLRAALLSPHFLYREARSGDLPLSPNQLANRLSYLLTLGPPDAPLLAAAQDDSLKNRDFLLKHARRLLDATTPESFAKNFVEQWLGTRAIPQITPSPQLGLFDGRHYDAFAKEPYLLFQTVLKENRPVSDLIDPDFTFTNFIVAKQIYQLDPPASEKGDADPSLVRIPLPKGGRRGGFLAMPGTMMATANGVDTQPVFRGKWVLENILNDPPPPPPPSVPAITPDTRGTKTVRDLMQAHTREESCAGCHRKLDPPGFVLENFDAIGNWRDHYPVHTTNAKGKPETKPGPPVDATGTLPDGTSLHDVTDLKRHVLTHLEDFVTCVASKLFIHGTGRIPDHAERKMLRSIAAKNLEQKGTLRDLILAVIESDDFRSR
jgi:hypothetical protein